MSDDGVGGPSFLQVLDTGTLADVAQQAMGHGDRFVVGGPGVQNKEDATIVAFHAAYDANEERISRLEADLEGRETVVKDKLTAFLATKKELDAFEGSGVVRQRMTRALNRQMRQIQFIQSHCDTLKAKIDEADMISVEFLDVLALTHDSAEPPTEAIDAMRKILEVRRAVATRSANPERVVDTAAGIKSIADLHTADEKNQTGAMALVHQTMKDSLERMRDGSGHTEMRTRTALSVDAIMAMYSDSSTRTSLETTSRRVSDAETVDFTESANVCIEDMLAQASVDSSAPHGGGETAVVHSEAEDHLDLNTDPL